MAHDPSQLGTRAAERIFARLDGDTSAIQNVVVAAKLIARGSGEIPPPQG
jgi:LacI family transcriptional regulator